MFLSADISRNRLGASLTNAEIAVIFSHFFAVSKGCMRYVDMAKVRSAFGLGDKFIPEHSLHSHHMSSFLCSLWFSLCKHFPTASFPTVSGISRDLERIWKKELCFSYRRCDELKIGQIPGL